MRLPLDHVGFVGADTQQLAETFRALGFHVTKPAVLSTSNTNDLSQKAVQSSAHIMFRNSYIELTSVKPCPPDHHLAAFQGQDNAIRLLVLHSEDAGQRAEQLFRAGLAVSDVSTASRALLYGKQDTAQFRWFSLLDDPVPRTLTVFVEHQTREAVFHQEVSQHPNSINRISALHHRPGSIPGALCDDSAYQVDLIETPAKEPGENPAGPFFVGMTLQAKNLLSCERDLGENQVPFECKGSSLYISATHAAGAVLYIEESK